MDSSIDDDYPFIVLTETKFSILGSIHHDEGLNNFLSLPLNIFLHEHACSFKKGRETAMKNVSSLVACFMFVGGSFMFRRRRVYVSSESNLRRRRNL